jgi:hypothetical protein
MSSERDILNKMKISTEMFLNSLKQINEIKAEIIQDIKKIDNNYFKEHSHFFEQYDAIFDEGSIASLIFIINPFIDNIKTEQTKMCMVHEYIKDSIDVGQDNSLTIFYCKHCLTSKNN